MNEAQKEKILKIRYLTKSSCSVGISGLGMAIFNKLNSGRLSGVWEWHEDKDWNFGVVISGEMEVNVGSSNDLAEDRIDVPVGVSGTKLSFKGWLEGADHVSMIIFDVNLRESAHHFLFERLLKRYEYNQRDLFLILIVSTLSNSYNTTDVKFICDLVKISLRTKKCWLSIDIKNILKQLLKWGLECSFICALKV